jgi:protein TonB
MAAQSEPTLVAVNMPTYPPLARQARIAGVVKLTFVLSGNAGEPTNVEVISGHPMLKDAAIENVKTWKFTKHYAEGTYQTNVQISVLRCGRHTLGTAHHHRFPRLGTE